MMASQRIRSLLFVHVFTVCVFVITVDVEMDYRLDGLMNGWYFHKNVSWLLAVVFGSTTMGGQLEEGIN